MESSSQAERGVFQRRKNTALQLARLKTTDGREMESGLRILIDERNVDVICAFEMFVESNAFFLLFYDLYISSSRFS